MQGKPDEGFPCIHSFPCDIQECARAAKPVSNHTILDGIKNRPMEYDDRIVRQLLECVVVDSKEQITVIFKGGLKSVQPLTK